jgi:hypothetical protein
MTTLREGGAHGKVYLSTQRQPKGLIRMTRAYNLTTVAAPRKVTARRIFLTLFAIIATPLILTFIIGAAMGVAQGISADHNRPAGPDAATLAILKHAQATSKTPCWAEWNFDQKGFEVLCGADHQVADYNDGFIDSKKDDCAQGDATACTWVATTKN